MRRTKLCSFAACGIAAFLACYSTLGAAAYAQEKAVELKLSHWVPSSHPLQKAIEDWAADVEKVSNGTIKSKIYPAQQLGKAFDHYDMARDGIADFAFVNPGYQPGRFPIIAAGELPFLIGHAERGSRAMDAWYRKFAADEMKDVHYCLSFVTEPLALHSSTKKVLLPSDVRGMKIKPAQGTIAAWITQLGGITTGPGVGEVRDVLAKGGADAVTFPWGSLVQFGIDKATKYHMDEPLGSMPFQWVMSSTAYNAMSVSQKKVIDSHCTSEWAARFAGPWAEFEHAGFERVKAEADHEVYTLADDQLAEWKDSAEPLQQKWAASVRKGGGDSDAIMRELRTSLMQYSAGP